jgi:RPEL repeat
MADETEKHAEIDETPISPIQRRDSLEKHLRSRPEAQDLKNRNILLNTNAAP